ncbi:MAG: hypothetical protein ACRCUY_02300, partial [Thermoguttaceae bacterium]
MAKKQFQKAIFVKKQIGFVLLWSLLFCLFSPLISFAAETNNQTTSHSFNRNKRYILPETNVDEIVHHVVSSAESLENAAIVPSILEPPIPQHRNSPQEKFVSDVALFSSDYSPDNSSAYSLSLSEVRFLATRHHPGVQQAAKEAEAIRGSWVQAGLQANPSIGYSGEEMTQDTFGKQGIVFDQTIIPKYKRTARQAEVAREYESARQI